jgi:alkylation response protein AidB-like acyl-CoA dehydrogenase
VRSYDEAQWKRMRESGRGAFMLKQGFFGRGLPMGMLTSVVVEIARGGVLPDALFTMHFFGLLVLAVAVFTLSGSLAARANWAIHERRHGASGRSSGGAAG